MKTTIIAIAFLILAGCGNGKHAKKEPAPTMGPALPAEIVPPLVSCDPPEMPMGNG